MNEKVEKLATGDIAAAGGTDRRLSGRRPVAEPRKNEKQGLELPALLLLLGGGGAGAGSGWLVGAEPSRHGRRGGRMRRTRPSRKGELSSAMLTATAAVRWYPGGRAAMALREHWGNECQGLHAAS